jgi:hypothetical protein
LTNEYFSVLVFSILFSIKKVTDMYSNFCSLGSRFKSGFGQKGSNPTGSPQHIWIGKNVKLQLKCGEHFLWKFTLTMKQSSVAVPVRCFTVFYTVNSWCSSSSHWLACGFSSYFAECEFASYYNYFDFGIVLMTRKLHLHPMNWPFSIFFKFEINFLSLQ